MAALAALRPRMARRAWIAPRAALAFLLLSAAVLGFLVVVLLPQASTPAPAVGLDVGASDDASPLDLPRAPLASPQPPPAAVRTSTTVPVQPEPAAATTEWSVQAGETLEVIARDFGTTVDALVTLNGLSNPDLIVVGQVLRLPLELAPDVGAAD